VADAIEGHRDHFEVADVAIRASIHNDGLIWYDARIGRYETDIVLSLEGALLTLEQVLLRRAADLALESTKVQR
jgi:hypothetical protein